MTTSNAEHLASPETADLSRMTPIQKADFVVGLLTSGGLMEPTQAREFWQIAIKGSARLSSYSNVFMKADTHKIDRFGFENRVLHTATSGQALPIGQRSVPTLGQAVLNPKLYKAQVNIDEEVFEDNIMQERLRSFVIQKVTEAVRRDMLEILIASDTASADPDLALFDGIIKSITSNTVDASDAALSKALLEDTVQILPSQYHDFDKLQFVTATNSWINYVSSIADRATVFADNVRESSTYRPKVLGIDLDREQNYPVNLAAGNNRTVATLFDPKNWHMGVHRNVKLKVQEDVPAGVFIIVVSVRFDGAFANEAATAQLTDVLPS